jgi:hypothetical protein
MMNWHGKLLFAVAAFGLMGCPSTDDKTRPPGDAGRSPNATLRPTPRSSQPPATLPRDAGYDGPIGIPADSKGRLILRDAQAPAPTPLVPTKALPADRAPSREFQGVTLAAEWRWDKVPSPPGGGEVNQAGLKTVRELTRHAWQIELLESGRMRVVFDSPSFPLTQFTEIRSRSDRFGHILVWPETVAYRVIPSGALRALLDDRRIDVSPLVAGTVGKEESGHPRFGFPTRKTSLTTPWGKLVLEQARTVNAGAGGQLLCRLLVELVSARPESSICKEGKLPVHANFAWKSGGSISFDVTSLLIRSDFPGALFTVPPPHAKFTDYGLPPNASGIFLTREQMAAFRSKDVEPPTPRVDLEANGAPGEGFLAVNRTDALRFLVLDGIPVAWVPAHGQQYLIGSRAGRYSVQWRSFLGMDIEDPQEVIVPARLSLGEPPDAGAPPGAAGAPPQ